MAPDAETGARTAAAAAAEEPMEGDEADEREEEEEREGEEEEPFHLPLAPLSELSDTSTTVDPSYIISLIRQLLPRDEVKQGDTKDCNNSHGELTQDCTDNVERFSTDREMPFVLRADDGTSQEIMQEERDSASDGGQAELFERKDPWEECGCILWDFSANKTHAELMVDNLLLEVLLASVHVSKSLRVKEICLGIIGNLACHDNLSSAIVSKNGLVEIVIQQLFLDDSTCLSETFRLLTAGLQGGRCASWAEALRADQVLLRVLWIIGNTLNSLLLEKSIDFLMAIINNQEVSGVLLQPLIELGLSKLMTSLLAGEVGKLEDENRPESSSNLDLVLGLIEALSTTDSYSQVIVSNEELLPLVCGLVKLPDKFEVANSCVSAIIIIANVLVDEQHLALELQKDFSFLHGLLDILPYVSDDLQARDAFWCIMARILGQVQENDISISTLQQFASLFAEKSQLIEEDVKSHSMEDLARIPGVADGHKSYATATSLRRIACIIERRIFENSTFSEKGIAGSDDRDDSKLQRLLHLCHDYVGLN